MYQTINANDFIRAFADMGRGDQFSREGLRALFEHLEEYEAEDCGDGPGRELDVIALCCEFSEYDSAVEAASQYRWERDADHDDDEAEADALDYLRDRTTAIEFDGGVIIQDF